MILLVHMMNFRKSFGPSILLKHRDKLLDMTSYTKTKNLYPIRYEWKVLKFKADKAHQDKIFS